MNPRWSAVLQQHGSPIRPRHRIDTSPKIPIEKELAFSNVKTLYYFDDGTLSSKGKKATKEQLSELYKQRYEEPASWEHCPFRPWWPHGSLFEEGRNLPWPPPPELMVRIYAQERSSSTATTRPDTLSLHQTKPQDIRTDINEVADRNNEGVLNERRSASSSETEEFQVGEVSPRRRATREAIEYQRIKCEEERYFERLQLRLHADWDNNLPTSALPVGTAHNDSELKRYMNEYEPKAKANETLVSRTSVSKNLPNSPLAADESKFAHSQERRNRTNSEREMKAKETLEPLTVTSSLDQEEENVKELKDVFGKPEEEIRDALYECSGDMYSAAELLSSQLSYVDPAGERSIERSSGPNGRVYNEQQDRKLNTANRNASSRDTGAYRDERDQPNDLAAIRLSGVFPSLDMATIQDVYIQCGKKENAAKKFLREIDGEANNRPMSGDVESTTENYCGYESKSACTGLWQSRSVIDTPIGQRSGHASTAPSSHDSWSSIAKQRSVDNDDIQSTDTLRKLITLLPYIDEGTITDVFYECKGDEVATHRSLEQLDPDNYHKCLERLPDSTDPYKILSDPSTTQIKEYPEHIEKIRRQRKDKHAQTYLSKTVDGSRTPERKSYPENAVSRFQPLSHDTEALDDQRHCKEIEECITYLVNQEKHYRDKAQLSSSAPVAAHNRQMEREFRQKIKNEEREFARAKIREDTAARQRIRYAEANKPRNYYDSYTASAQGVDRRDFRQVINDQNSHKLAPNRRQLPEEDANVSQWLREPSTDDTLYSCLPENYEVDLHGIRANAAEDVVSNDLIPRALSSGVHRIFLVVGSGRHSKTPGKSPLAEQVGSTLREQQQAGNIASFHRSGPKYVVNFNA